MLKIFYLFGSLVSTVIILIIAFENIQAVCTNVVVFYKYLDANATPTSLIFWLAGLGMICGFFYHGLLRSFFEKKDEEDDF